MMVESTPQYVIIYALLSAVILVGCVGNFSVLLVYSRAQCRFGKAMQKQRQLPLSRIVTTLALADFLVCSTVVPMTVTLFHLGYQTDSTLFCRAYIALSSANINFSVLLLGFVAVERYVTICHARSRGLKPSLEKICIALLVLVTAGFGVLASLCYGVLTVEIPSTLKEKEAVFKLEQNQKITADVVTATRENTSLVTEGTLDAEAGSYAILADSFGMLQHEHAVGAPQETTNSSFCALSTQILSPGFAATLKNIQTVWFLACVLVILVAYACILAFVFRHKRRLKRNRVKMQQASAQGATDQQQENADAEEKILMVDEAGTTSQSPRPAFSSFIFSATQMCQALHGTPANRPVALMGTSSPALTTRRVISRALCLSREKQFKENVKLTMMLLVVIVVVIVTFTPASLITYGIISDSEFPLLYYIYFINNAANPLIYGFMNSKFRRALLTCFRCSGQRAV